MIFLLLKKIKFYICLKVASSLLFCLRATPDFFRSLTIVTRCSHHFFSFVLNTSGSRGKKDKLHKTILLPGQETSYITNYFLSNFQLFTDPRLKHCGLQPIEHLGRIPPEISNGKIFFNFRIFFLNFFKKHVCSM